LKIKWTQERGYNRGWTKIHNIHNKALNSSHSSSNIREDQMGRRGGFKKYTGKI
jgi:hypothetical protein